MRALLPGPGSGIQPTTDQLLKAAQTIEDYTDNHTKPLNPSEVFSLHWHAFQLYAQCDPIKTQELLAKSIALFENMSTADLQNLHELYGPTVKPYLEATAIFFGNDPNKKQLLEKKLEEILRVPMNEYPRTNVVFFPGRVHDMAINPEETYSEIFRSPTKLPPLPGTSNWVQAKTPQQVNVYMAQNAMTTLLNKRIQQQQPSMGPPPLHQKLDK